MDELLTIAKRTSKCALIASQPLNCRTCLMITLFTSIRRRSFSHRKFTVFTVIRGFCASDEAARAERVELNQSRQSEPRSRMSERHAMEGGPDGESLKYERLRQAFDFAKLPLVRPKDLKGIGGVIKDHPSFFDVEEIPHTDGIIPPDQLVNDEASVKYYYVTITRSGMDTRSVKTRLRRLLHLNEDGIGYAGLKDKHARTTQMFSVSLNKVHRLKKYHMESLVKEDIRAAIESDEELPKITMVGDLIPARRKLTPGLLEGNMFRILVTNLSLPLDEAYVQANKILESLIKIGVPNYFGPQRLGSSAKSCLAGYHSVRLAEEFLASEYPELTKSGQADEDSIEQDSSDIHKKRKARTPSKKEYYQWIKKKQHRSRENFGSRLWSDRFCLNAFQSGIFNYMLSRRILSSLFNLDSVGDYVSSPDRSSANRFIDSEEQLTSEEERQAGVSFTLPIIGKGYRKRDDSEVKKLELDALEYIQLNQNTFPLLGMENDKRVGRLSVPLMQLRVEKVASSAEFLRSTTDYDPASDSSSDGEALCFYFQLPKNTFATSVLREFTEDHPDTVNESKTES